VYAHVFPAESQAAEQLDPDPKARYEAALSGVLCDDATRTRLEEIGSAHDWEPIAAERRSAVLSEMARAAAKQRPPARRHDPGRKHKDSGGQRYEDTLFFNRLRTHARWLFVLLIVVCADGFVFLGVGSSGLGLGDLFNGITGSGSSGPSVGKSLEDTAKTPKDAQAWKNLATADEGKADYASAASAWQQYTRLRPKDADGVQLY